MRLYEVLRPFPAPDGKVFQVGELVDASDWRTCDALVRMGKIRVAKSSPVKNATTPKKKQVTTSKDSGHVDF